MTCIRLVGDFVFERIGPVALEAYRESLVEAANGDCDDQFHNKLANVGAGISQQDLNEQGSLSDDDLRGYLDSMHLARVTCGYSDDWYWKFVLELAFNRKGDEATAAEKARRLYVQATGLSDRAAYTKQVQEFYTQLLRVWYGFRRRDEFNITLTPASIRLYERAGIEPHVAIIPAKRGGEPSTYVSPALKDALVDWGGLVKDHWGRYVPLNAR